MKRTYTWKMVVVLLGAFLLIALGCQISGNSGMASVFVLMGVMELLLGVVVIMIRNVMQRDKSKSASPLSP